MILKNHSLSKMDCWFKRHSFSWSWWSLFKSNIGRFEYTERSYVWDGVTSKSWSKNHYESSNWANKT